MSLDLISVCVVAVAQLVFRLLIGQLSYSGEATPPKFGDYEAQRHWLEVTYHLPAADWYRQTDANDLQWWGLDYPPLTAYVSLFFAWAATLLLPAADGDSVPAMLQLGASRGYESWASKMFMRGTVLFADVVVFWSGVYFFVRWFVAAQPEHHADNTDTESKNDDAVFFSAELAMFFLLLCPPLLLIDHGHFQYNAVALGLSVWAAVLIARDRPLLGSVAYCLALNFKHIGAYYALAFFCYLLRWSWEASRGRLLPFAGWVTRLGLVVLAVFALLWWPFNPLDVVDRLVPVARGVFEDKVANFWCTLSVAVKLHLLLDKSTLFVLCAAATLLAALPSCCLCLLAPSSLRKLLLTLASCSLAFFLFSYQVHEKSVLFAVLPVALLAVLTGDAGFAVWFLATASFSMYPLLVRDGHAASYFATQLAVLLFFFPWKKTDWRHAAYKLSFAVMAAIHLAGAAFDPPARWPDLLAVAISAFSFTQFAIAYCHLHIQQYHLLYPTHQHIN